ncbi:LmbE-like protein [Dentipellis sp. KUC8613]|nr:LmbE-like protein [Dentipellis sp. KUC8613]
MPGNGFRLVFYLLPLILASLFTPWHHSDALLKSAILSTNGVGTTSKILLLTAHPDDECMFFGPTITSFLSTLQVQPHSKEFSDGGDTTHAATTFVPKPELYSLCLSVGDADGLGVIRREELGKSLDVLGVGENRRWVLDVEGLQDNFTAMWNSSLIADVITPYILTNNITTVLTFDQHGISSHPNHLSLYYGVSNLLSQLSPRGHDVHAYALVSIPTSSKYLGPTAPILAKLHLSITWILQRLGFQPSENGLTGGEGTAIFVAGFREYSTAVRAMLQHRSQLVWFRWLYVAFSRYMWVNEWVPISPEA